MPLKLTSNPAQVPPATHWQATFQAGQVLRGQIGPADLSQLAGRDPRCGWSHDASGGKHRQAKPDDLAELWQRLLANHLEPLLPHQAFTLSWLTAAEFAQAEAKEPRSLAHFAAHAAKPKPRRKAQ